MNKYTCGFVAIVGRTNAGKSTLINQLIKQKIAIVSPKAQTSRDNTLGIYNDDDSQIIFVDTPGYHKVQKKIDEYMIENISSASVDADVIMYVLDGKKPLLEQYEILNKAHKKSKCEKIIVINKIDDTTFQKLYPQIDILAKNSEIKEILPLSALKGTNCDILIETLKSMLPKFDYKMQYYPTDMFTDKNVRFMAGEIIREQALFLYEEEIPHGVAVCIQSFDESDNLTKITADIICEKESHKTIIIGHNGDKIKTLSQKSRLAIEKYLDTKVYLELFVKVKQNWRDNNGLLANFGYSNKP